MAELRSGMLVYMPVYHAAPWLHTPEMYALKKEIAQETKETGFHRNGRPRGWWRIGAGTTENQKKAVSRAMRGVPKSAAHRAKISARVASRGWGSQLERGIFPYLRRLGFKHQYRLGGHAYDFGHKQLRLLVEVNGCFWHYHSCRPVTSIRSLTAQETRRRDRRNILAAVTRGYQVLTLWECQQHQWKTMIMTKVGP